jgi:hypothetical protein
LFFYILSTDIATNQEVKFYTGYGIVINLIGNLGVNLTIFFYNAYLAIKPKFIKFWAKYIGGPEP